MWIAYDEAGTMGTLEARDSPIQPIFVLAAIFLHRKHLPPLTRDFLALKRRFFPNLFQGEDQYLYGILREIKGQRRKPRVIRVMEISTAPSNETDGPMETRDLRGSRQAAAGREVALRRPERSRCGTVPGVVSDLAEAPAAPAPPVSAETQPSEATKPKVWNVFDLLKTIPHRARNADETGDNAASQEKAA